MECSWHTVRTKAASCLCCNSCRISTARVQTINYNRLSCCIQRHLAQQFVGHVRLNLNLPKTKQIHLNLNLNSIQLCFVITQIIIIYSISTSKDTKKLNAGRVFDAYLVAGEFTIQHCYRGWRPAYKCCCIINHTNTNVGGWCTRWSIQCFTYREKNGLQICLFCFVFFYLNERSTKFN